jgi:hypothetical protein
MKIKDIESENGRIYLQTWVNALNVLLGWSEERTLTWAKKFRTELNHEDDLLFHWGPSKYFIRLIIPEALNESLNSNETVELRKLLLDIIERNGQFSDQKPNFDWHLAKRLIERVLRQVELLKINRGKNVERVLRSKRRKFEARMRSRAKKGSKVREKQIRKFFARRGISGRDTPTK